MLPLVPQPLVWNCVPLLEQHADFNISCDRSLTCELQRRRPELPDSECDIKCRWSTKPFIEVSKTLPVFSPEADFLRICQEIFSFEVLYQLREEKLILSHKMVMKLDV